MIYDSGLIDYEKCYKVQKEFVRKRKLGEIGDVVILAEHEPVFTIGRTGKPDNLLVTKDYLKEIGVRVVDVDRGGDITFHGPGQIVVYPILDLKERHRDLHRYLRDLEEVCINFLKEYHVEGHRIAGRTGVWVDSKKIAFIGIGSSNWVTFHGLSININTDLGYFSMINPCGMRDIEVTSLSEITRGNIDMESAKQKVIKHFDYIFAKRIDAHHYASAMA